MSKKQKQLLILVCLCVGVAGGIVYSCRDAIQNAPTEAVTRSAFDFEVDWVCLECGDTTSAPAAAGARACAKCGKTTAYPSFRHACPQHGEFRVFYEYDEAGDIKAVRVTDKGQWVPFRRPEGGFGTVCPTCGNYISPVEGPRAVKRAEDELPPD